MKIKLIFFRTSKIFIKLNNNYKLLVQVKNIAVILVITIYQIIYIKMSVRTYK